MIATLATLVLLAQVPSVGCVEDDYFEFRVDRLPPGEVKALELRFAPPELERGGTVGLVRDGRIRVCIAGGKPGAIVRVSIVSGAAPYEVFYPYNGLVPLHRQLPPSIMVRTRARIARDVLLPAVGRAAAQSNPGMNLGKLSEFVDAWMKYLREHGSASHDVLEALESKSRQVAVATKDLDLLSRFSRRALAAVDGYRRHALPWLRHGDDAEAEALRKVTDAYRPVVEDIGEHSASLELEFAQHWSGERSAELRSLLRDARSIHSRIAGLNEVKQLILACLRGWRECPGQDEAERQVESRVAEIARDVEARLTTLDRRRDAFLDALRAEALGRPAISLNP